MPTAPARGARSPWRDRRLRPRDTNACQTSVGDTESGWINVSDGVQDKDWWGVILESGKEYEIYVESRDNANPKVKVFNSLGEAVPGFEAGSGGGAEVTLTFEPDQTGVFYIEVSDQQGDDTDNYQLSVTEV